ncbi:MAG: hypothetical protein LBB77_05825 [Treponema sp.]|nr:hypothetical protein [Treponema sp.]
MNIQNALDVERGVLALQSGWNIPDMPEPAEWPVSGCLDAGGELFEPGPGNFPSPGLAFGDEDEDDDVDDDEDNFDDMEDDFEDDDFEDEDDEDDDYDYDDDGDFDDDFGE